MTRLRELADALADLLAAMLADAADAYRQAPEGRYWQGYDDGVRDASLASSYPPAH